MNVILVLLAFLAILGVVAALAVRAYLRTDGARPTAVQTLIAETSAAVGRTVTATYTEPFRDHEYGRSSDRRRGTLRITAGVDEAGGAVAEERPLAGARPAMRLRPETAFDRLGKRLGLSREIQTGDRTFDERVFVETDAPDAEVMAVLSALSFRQAVVDLLSEGGPIDLDRAGLSAEFLCARSENPYDRARFQHRAELLAAAARALPLFAAGRVTPRRSMRPLAFGLVALVIGTLAIAGAGLSHPLLDRRPALSVAVPIGLGLWAAAVAFGVRRFRGRHDALDRLAALAACTAICLPTSLYGGLLWTNAALDRSQPVEHPTRITGKWVDGGSRDRKGDDGPVSVGVTVASWRQGETSRSLTSDELYRKGQVGAPVVVTTRAGRLGWEWQAGARLGGDR